MSILQQGQAAVAEERGHRRSGKMACIFLSWFVREYLPDCHKDLVECYRSSGCHTLFRMTFAVGSPIRRFGNFFTKEVPL